MTVGVDTEDSGVTNLSYDKKEDIDQGVTDTPVSEEDIKLQNFNGNHHVIVEPDGDVTSDQTPGYEIDPSNGDLIFKKKELHSTNSCSLSVARLQTAIGSAYSKSKKVLWTVIGVILLILYLAYVIYSLQDSGLDTEPPIRLLVCTIFGLFLLALHLLRHELEPLYKFLDTLKTSPKYSKPRRYIQWALYIMSTVATVTLIIVLVALETPENLRSLGGLAALLIICYVTSFSPAMIEWHPVFWGFSLQFYFAVIILKTQWGVDTFRWLGDRVTEFLLYSDAGAKFVFGDDGYFKLKDGAVLNVKSALSSSQMPVDIKTLQLEDNTTLVFAAVYTFHFFAFKVLPVVVFFSSFIAVLTYIGVMKFIVRNVGQFLSFCLATTPAESLNAAGNIFIGMAESPLMIRPFLKKMTSSELHAIMVGGFATIAGSVLGVYIGFGVSPDHLLSASVMSAPAALAISKITYPEIEVPVITDKDYDKVETSDEGNLIQAACNGAVQSTKICAAIVVNVIAFLALLEFVNATLTWFGDRAGLEFKLTFEYICSYVLYPIALFMGVDTMDCRKVAELVGIKTFTNEFIAFDKLAILLKNRKAFTAYVDDDPTNNWYHDGDDIVLEATGVRLIKGILEPRSEVIATYALCGFSNFGSMGILLGSLSALAPNRTPTMSKLIFRAMVAGNIACFFTACIAGLFYEA